MNEARSNWRVLLGRPEEERHYRSTWAAYMLGRTCGTNEWEQAVGYYQEVRRLAKEGFADSLGLAAASLGWEAQANLRQKKFEPAIELYLEQFAAGDSNSAEVSLRFACHRALNAGNDTLAALAKNPRTAAVHHGVRDRGWISAHLF